MFSLSLKIANGQVVNDDIEKRLELKLNEPKVSNTTDCSLQWSCINRTLTRKCIQYHNDQWFYFNAADHTRLFLNVSRQECRDMRGIQVIVIDGEACQPEKYTITRCVSFGNHDDVFVELDDLVKHKEYLVQIDGYLNDFCSFQIEISDQAKGMPTMEKPAVDAESSFLDQDIVSLSWNVSDSLATLVSYYEIWRLFESDFKSNLVGKYNQVFNARRAPKLQYAVRDTLTKYGSYNYKIIAVSDNERTMVSSTSVYNEEPKIDSDEEKHWLKLDLYYPYQCRVSISVFDARRQVLLNYFNFNYRFENRTFETYIKKYIEAGIFEYRLQVENLGNGEKQNYLIKK